MTWSVRELESVAVRLPVHERARLAERLLTSSLDEDAEVEQAWAEEVRKRLEDYRSGGLTAVSGAEVFADARAHLSLTRQDVGPVGYGPHCRPIV